MKGASGGDEVLGSVVMTVGDPHRVVEAVWRIESARVIAGLARMTHDVGLAEELAQDALVIALERWPESGVPDNPVLLLDQDRGLLDRLLIRRGLDALERAEALGTLGPYGLQAAIAACHARALSAEDTAWERMAALYRVLAHVAPSPVVELNRAVAVSMAYGPARGLEIVDGLVEERALKNYPQLPAVRGDLLAKLGRLGEAREEFERAAALTRNEREQTLFLARAAATGG